MIAINVVRGLFFEGWRPADPPRRVSGVQAFADLVAMDLPPAFPRQATEAINDAFSRARHPD